MRTKLKYNNTIQDIDTLVMDYMKNVIGFQIKDYDGTVRKIPIVYHGAERWVQVRRRNYLVDQTYNVIYPVISFSRTSLKQVDGGIAGRQWNPTYRNYIVIDNKYTKERPYSKFDLQFGNIAKKKQQYKMALPIPLEISYEFQAFTNNNQQMNKIFEYFLLNANQWWFIGQKRARMMFSDFNNTTQIQAQGERLIKANFNATCHASLFPYDVYQGAPSIEEISQPEISVSIGEENS